MTTQRDKTLARKLAPVDIVGATVWFRTEERLALLTDDGFILWAHFDDQHARQFKGQSAREGEVLWVYFVRALMTTARSIVSLVPQGDGAMTMAELPAIDPIEIDK